jgi:hypothetical protein
MAVPLSFTVTIGSAILSEVASSAAARVIMQIEMKAKMKPLVGLKTGDSSSVVDLAFESEELPDWEGGDNFDGLFSAMGVSRVIFLDIIACYSLERCSGKEQMLERARFGNKVNSFY